MKFKKAFSVWFPILRDRSSSAPELAALLVFGFDVDYDGIDALLQEILHMIQAQLKQTVSVLNTQTQSFNTTVTTFGVCVSVCVLMFTWLITSWILCSLIPSGWSVASKRNTLLSWCTPPSSGSAHNQSNQSISKYINKDNDNINMIVRLWLEVRHCTWMAGVEVQTGFCWLQQPLDDPVWQQGRTENHRPFAGDPNHLNQTERDQLLLMTYKHTCDISAHIILSVTG